MTSLPPSTIQRRYDCLDGLRAVLAVYVVVHHAWLGVFVQDPKALSWVFNFLAFGRDAVCFFLVLSGFCLMLPTLEHGYRLPRGIFAFIKRRSWRILPPYYSALAISILIDWPVNHTTAVSGPGFGIIFPVTHDNIRSHVLLIHNFFLDDIYKINPALWSIPIEWQIYFLFPLLLLAWRYLGSAIATAAAVVLSALIERQLNLYHGMAPCVHFIGLFALGMLAARFATSAQYKSVTWLPVTCGLAAIFAVSSCVGNPILADDIFGMFAALLLVVILVDPASLVHRCLNWKPLVTVGTFSYSIYLVHALILQSIWIYLLPHLHFGPNSLCVAFIFLGVPVSLAIAWLFHLAFEKPFLQIRERKVVHVR